LVDIATHIHQTAIKILLPMGIGRIDQFTLIKSRETFTQENRLQFSARFLKAQTLLKNAFFPLFQNDDCNGGGGF
jgi:hypothetical protein